MKDYGVDNFIFEIDIQPFQNNGNHKDPAN